LETALLKFEKIEKISKERMKVGVLFCDVNQTSELEMFGNLKESPSFSNFLSFLGKRIPLSGFKGYAGDLDVTEKCLDGPESLFALVNSGRCGIKLCIDFVEIIFKF
jgi:hypothetical protein